LLLHMQEVVQSSWLFINDYFYCCCCFYDMLGYCCFYGLCILKYYWLAVHCFVFVAMFDYSYSLFFLFFVVVVISAVRRIDSCKRFIRYAVGSLENHIYVVIIVCWFFFSLYIYIYIVFLLFEMLLVGDIYIYII
jgi:hypothetical protein